jgi:hypothetical protein
MYIHELKIHNLFPLKDMNWGRTTRPASTSTSAPATTAAANTCASTCPDRGTADVARVTKGAGVDVMRTIFREFRQFSAKKLAFF